MITRQPSPPAANGRRFGTMRPRRTRYVTRNQGVFRNRKNRFHTWTEIFSGLTERCDATFLIHSYAECASIITPGPWWSRGFSNVARAYLRMTTRETFAALSPRGRYSSWA